MRVYRTLLRNPSSNGEPLAVFVAECELCGFTAMSVNEQDATRVMERHNCGVDEDGASDDDETGAA